MNKRMTAFMESMGRGEPTAVDQANAWMAEAHALLVEVGQRDPVNCCWACGAETDPRMPLSLRNKIRRFVGMEEA